MKAGKRNGRGYWLWRWRWLQRWRRNRGLHRKDSAGPGDGPITDNPRYNQKTTASRRSSAQRSSPAQCRGGSSEADAYPTCLPPSADELAHPDSGPLRPMTQTGSMSGIPCVRLKDVEVGDYYYKKENYAAALKPLSGGPALKNRRDAVADVQAGQTLEKNKQFEEAAGAVPGVS